MSATNVTNARLHRPKKPRAGPRNRRRTSSYDRVGTRHRSCACRLQPRPCPRRQVPGRAEWCRTISGFHRRRTPQARRAGSGTPEDSRGPRVPSHRVPGAGARRLPVRVRGAGLRFGDLGVPPGTVSAEGGEAGLLEHPAHHLVVPYDGKKMHVLDNLSAVMVQTRVDTAGTALQCGEETDAPVGALEPFLRVVRNIDEVTGHEHARQPCAATLCACVARPPEASTSRESSVVSACAEREQPSP